MSTVTLEKAQTELAKLIAEVESGREVTILSGDRPVAKLVPATPRKAPRVPGRYKGQFEVGPAFFEPMSDEDLRLWGMK